MFDLCFFRWSSIVGILSALNRPCLCHCSIFVAIVRFDWQCSLLSFNFCGFHWLRSSVLSFVFQSLWLSSASIVSALFYLSTVVTFVGFNRQCSHLSFNCCGFHWLQLSVILSSGSGCRCCCCWERSMLLLLIGVVICGLFR